MTTRVATYGDMGHSHYNNMQNLRDDAANGLIDVVVHMGDHCYNLGQANDRRGDAYMNAFQPALATVPWFPIIGNHEWVYKLNANDSFVGDGDRGRHYQAIAWGEAYGTMMTCVLLTPPQKNDLNYATPPVLGSPAM